METTLEPGAWATLAIIWLAALAAPGPDFFLLLRLASRSRRAALLGVLGIMTGNTLWSVLTVFGLGSLLKALPWSALLFQTLGALVLAVLGVQAILSGARGIRGGHAHGAVSRPGRAFGLGFVSNLSNPKALVFFTAMFTQVFPAEITIQDRALAILLIVSLGFAWFVPLALAASADRFRGMLRRAASWLDIAGGAVFVLVGAGMLIELLVSLPRA